MCGGLHLPGVSHSNTSPHLTSINLLKLPFKCSSQIVAPVASASDEQMSPMTL